MRLTDLWLSIKSNTTVFAVSRRLASLFRPQFWATMLGMRARSLDVGSKDAEPIKKSLHAQGADSTRRAKLKNSSAEKSSARRSSIKQ